MFELSTMPDDDENWGAVKFGSYLGGDVISERETFYQTENSGWCRLVFWCAVSVLLKEKSITIKWAG